MIKIPKFDNLNLQNLKKMGEDLVDSVKSGDILGKKSEKELLPEDIKTRMEVLEKRLGEFREAQKAMDLAAGSLVKEAKNLGEDVLTVCLPKEQPVAEKEEAVAEQPKEEPVAEKETQSEDKPSE